MLSPRFLVLAATVAAVWTSLLAQAPPESVKPPPVSPGIPGVTPTPPPSVEDPGPRLDFAFDNTPLLEVISVVQDQYQKAAGRPLNVMVPESLRDMARTNLITLNVNQMTVDELFQMLGLASQINVPYISAWNFSGGRTVPIISRFDAKYEFDPLPLTKSSRSAPLTFLLRGQFARDTARPELMNQDGIPSRNEPTNQEPPRLVQFYSLESVLDRYSVEDVTTAIKTGWELSGAKTQPTMKFHEETKLLVVAGDQYQHQMVSQVLGSLRESKPGVGVGRGVGVPGTPVTQPVPVNPTPTPQ